MAKGQQSIFIGYRREDTGGDAGRIYDRLTQAFGRERVFKDVDSIPRGVRFREYVQDIIGRCRVVIVLIGPKWIDSRDEDGNRRLENPEDLVRVEIETALSTPKVQVLPVLVAGAPMPRRDQLPGALTALYEFNAADLRRDPDFNSDMDRLIRVIETGAVVRRRNPLLVFAMATLVTLGLAGGGFAWWSMQNPPADEAALTETADAATLNQGQPPAATAPATTPRQETVQAPPQQAAPPPEVRRAAVAGSWEGTYQCASALRPEGQTQIRFEADGGRLTSAAESFSRGPILSGATNYEVTSQSDDGRSFTVRTAQYGGYEINFVLSRDGSTLSGDYRGHSSCTTMQLRRR